MYRCSDDRNASGRKLVSVIMMVWVKPNISTQRCYNRKLARYFCVFTILCLLLAYSKLFIISRRMRTMDTHFISESPSDFTRDTFTYGALSIDIVTVGFQTQDRHLNSTMHPTSSESTVLSFYNATFTSPNDDMLVEYLDEYGQLCEERNSSKSLHLKSLPQCKCVPDTLGRFTVYMLESQS